MRVLGDNRQILDHCRRDNEPIKGIAVVKRKSADGEEMGPREREGFDGISLQRSDETGFERFSEPEFPQRLFDGHFPKLERILRIH